MNTNSLCQSPSFAALFAISADRRRTLEMLSLSSRASVDAQSTSCLGTTASANMSASPDQTRLSVESHRGNTADFSAGPGGASLHVSKNDDRPSRSEFLAALQANFGC